MKTILTSLALTLLLAPALQAGDHKKQAPSSEERRIQDAQKRLEETAQKINAAKRTLELLTRRQENNAKSLKQYQTDLANKKAAAEKRAQEEAAKKRARDEAIKKKAQESDTAKRRAAEAAKRRQAPAKKPQRPAPSKAEATLASQLAATEKAMAQLREQQNELSEKRSAIYKQLIEVRKREQAAKKKEADARAAKSKAEQEAKKKQAAEAAAKSRAEFLKRFDQNRDGQVTKDETRATLAEEAKRRAAEREKVRQK